MSGFKRSFVGLAVLALIAAPSSAAQPPRLALHVQVEGSTIAGPINVHLMVWDNGGVELLGENAIVGAASCQAQLSPEAVGALKQGLVRSGAGRLRSRVVDDTADLPSTTVTLFLTVEGSEQSVANTFVFNVAEGAYSRVQDKILEFARETFPDCKLSF